MTTDYRMMRYKELCDLNKLAVANDYNRALDPAWLAVDVERDAWHILSPVLIHEHANGVRVMAHMRCRVIVAQNRDRAPVEVWLDVPLDALAKLPKVPDEFLASKP